MSDMPLLARAHKLGGWALFLADKKSLSIRVTEETLSALVAEQVALATAEYKKALKEIAEIENRYDCGDWDEIEEAREIAKRGLTV